jgi:hypothetical protein
MILSQHIVFKTRLGAFDNSGVKKVTYSIIPNIMIYYQKRRGVML